MAKDLGKYNGKNFLWEKKAKNCLDVKGKHRIFAA